MTDTNGTQVLANAIEKLHAVDLTFDELAAVAAAVLDDDVHGFGPQGNINWSLVASVVPRVSSSRPGLEPSLLEHSSISSASSLQECTISK